MSTQTVSIQHVLQLEEKKRKKVRYSFLANKINPKTGQLEALAIVIPKHRRGCPLDLIISIGKVRPVVRQKRQRRK